MPTPDPADDLLKQWQDANLPATDTAAEPAAPEDDLLAQWESKQAAPAGPSPLQVTAAERKARLDASLAKQAEADRARKHSWLNDTAQQGNLLGLVAQHLPDMVQEWLSGVGHDSALVATDLAANSGGFGAGLLSEPDALNPEQRGMYEALSPPSRRIVDTLRNTVGPEAIFNMVVMTPAKATSDMITALSPVAWGAHGFQWASPQDQAVAIASLYDTLKGFTGGGALQHLATVYGKEGPDGVIEALADDPTLAVGLAFPLLLVGAAHPSVKSDLARIYDKGGSPADAAAYIDQKARDNLAEIRRRAYEQAAVNLQKPELVTQMKSQAVEQQVGRAPDPAVALTTRILTRQNPDGTYTVRTPAEFMRDNAIQPEVGVASPAGIQASEQVARLMDVLSRDTQTRELVPPPGFTPEQQAAIQADLRRVAPPEKSGVRPGLEAARVEARQPMPGTIAVGMPPQLSMAPSLEPGLGRALRPGEVELGRRATAIGTPAPDYPNIISPRPLASVLERREADRPRALNKVLGKVRQTTPYDPTGDAIKAEIDRRAAFNRGMPPDSRLDLDPDAVAGALRDQTRRTETPIAMQRMAAAGATPEEANRLYADQIHALATDTPEGAAITAARIRDEIRAGVARTQAKTPTAPSPLPPDLRPSSATPEARARARSKAEDIMAWRDVKKAMAEEEAGPEGAAVSSLASLEAALKNTTGLSDATARSLQQAFGQGFRVEAPGASANPDAVLRRTGVGGRTALEAAAADKGLTVTLDSRGYSVSGPTGILYSGGSDVEAAVKIRDFTPPTDPSTPMKPGPDPKPSSGEAGFVRTDIIPTIAKAVWQAGEQMVVKGTAELADILTSKTRAKQELWKLYFAKLNNTQFAREPELAKILPGEDTTIGANLIGKTLTGLIRAEKAVSDSQEILKRPGIISGKLGLTEGGVLWKAGFRPGETAGLYDVMDSLILDKINSDNSITSVARPTMDSSKLAVREDAGARAIDSARRAWDSWDTKKRAAAIALRQHASEVWVESRPAQLASETFRELDDFLALGEAPAKTVKTMLRQHAEYPALTAFRASGGDISLPSQQLGPAVRDFSRRFAITPEGNRILLSELKSGPPISAYIAHIGNSGIKLNSAVWDQAQMMLPKGVNADSLGTELMNALAADARPYVPTDAPNLRFNTTVEAMRHLFPGADDTTLGNFIRDLHAVARDNAGWTRRLVSVVPDNLFVRYLRPRINPEAPGAPDVFDVMNGYFAAMARKNHVEPALDQAKLQLRNIADPFMRAEAEKVLGYMTNPRMNFMPGTRGVLSKVAAVGAEAVLRAKFGVGLGNLTQLPFLGNATMGRLRGRGINPVEAKFAAGLLTDKSFWNTMLETGMFQEAMPYDISNINTGELISALRNAREAHDGNSAIFWAKEAERLGWTALDTVRSTEIINRVGTAAWSMTKTMSRLQRNGRSLIDLAIEARKNRQPFSLLPAEHETMINTMALDQGNTNFYIGRGANRVRWQAALRQSPLGPLADPMLMMTSYKQGLEGEILSSVRRFSSTDPLTRLKGYQELGGLITRVIIASGPFAAFGYTIYKLDDELNLHGQLIKFADAWERDWSIGGRIAGAETDKRVGLICSVSSVRGISTSFLSISSLHKS